jgi:DNA-binding response OmpR family regulator
MVEQCNNERNGATMTSDHDRPQRILVIDDEPNSLRLMTEHLANQGFEILVSEDGESGLRRARYARPDLILLDVILPDVDGFELCRQLKMDEKTAAIPVIFMTVLSIPEDKTKAFTLGGVDYITKPVQWEEVLARVTLHLRLRDFVLRLRAAEDALVAMARLQQENLQLRQQIVALEQELRTLRPTYDRS